MRIKRVSYEATARKKEKTRISERQIGRGNAIKSTPCGAQCL
jgi:hypothetical protein